MYSSPYHPPRPTSPYNHPPAQPQGAPAIAPGAITYTTSIGADGRPVYQSFKAVAASYQTPNGVVHGIQWVPAEATQILPAGAQPASPEFTASWGRQAYKPEYMQDWQRDDGKRKKKEKEEAKARERRRSVVGAPVVFPASPGYPTSPYLGTAPGAYPARDRKQSHTDLDRQFNDLNVSGRPRKYSTSEGAGPPVSGGYPYGTAPGPYSKPYPATGPHMSAYSNPSPNMRAADVLPGGGYPASPYTASMKPTEPIARAASPAPSYGYPQPPRSRATTPIPGTGPSYPQPRSRAASPVPGYTQPRSRAASPMPGGMPLPAEMSFDRPQQPALPECFSRAPNTTYSYPPFDPIKIQDMDEFLERLPKLPLVLQSHDVSHHDWVRLTQDLSVAWAGKMPIPQERAASPPKRSSIVAELLQAWNAAFFMPRGVEVVLYKGTIRYSGPKAGIADFPLKHEDDSDDSESSSEESSDDERYIPQPVGLYGASFPVPMAPSSSYSSESGETRRRRREEKKRRRKEKRMKRKQRERGKKFSLFITYMPIGGQGAMPGGYPNPRY
ncbi:hypothetical protein APHAL10511_002093 [Amanita phalloides]|nr:hypothetical protein APHAL10511_002093 [Amanita phalloides]